MSTTTNVTKSERLLRALFKGPMTVKAITSRLKIPNPRATVSYLRQQGYQIALDDSGPVSKYYAVR